MADGIAEALSLPPAEAIRFFLGKVNTPTQRWDDVWGAAHSRAFMVAGAATDALLGDFRAEITRALEQGTTLADFRRGFDDIVARHGWVHNGSPAWRSRIIFETNLSMAYSAGRYAQMTDPDTLGVFPFWQYVHSGSAHPRKQHLAWNGLVLRADDGFWKTHYPPNGWRCGCRVRPLSGRDLARQGKAAPDHAPKPEMRTHTDGRGITHQVPVGIDPGFEYNPGEAWKGPVGIPADAAVRVPPFGFPPPAPVVAAPPPALVPRLFASVDEADRHLTSAYADWAKGLSPAEENALQSYKAQFGYQMNEALRGTGPVNPYRKKNTALEAALSRAEAPDTLRVWRGVSGDHAETLRRLVPGDIVTDKGFMSTTVDPAIRDKFAALLPHMDPADAGVALEFVVPKGYPGVAYVNRVPTENLPEAEVLFRPGQRLRVVEVIGNLIKAEIIP